MSSLLVAGAYRAAETNLAARLTFAMAASRQHRVTHRWAALGDGACDVPATVMVLPAPVGRFAALNHLLQDAGQFDWCILVDDTVEIGDDFVDTFLAVALRHDFALCQPARREDSLVAHGIALHAPGLSARRTRFVELAPLVAIRRDAVPYLLPFPADADQGWGIDFIWPARLEAVGLRMGVVDATPIAQRLRWPPDGPAEVPSAGATGWRLATERHLTEEQAFRVIEAYV